MVFGPESFGRVMGTAGLIILPFGFVAPIAAGALRDAAGDYVNAFTVFMMAFAAATGFLALMRMPAREGAAE